MAKILKETGRVRLTIPHRPPLGFKNTHATGLTIENEDPLVIVGRQSDHRTGVVGSAHHAIEHDGPAGRDHE